jgi:hypothetical protein
MRRRRLTAGLTEEMVLAWLADADHELAVRALRRHRAWRTAVDRGAGPRAQRVLRRAWERARDEALVALSAAEIERRATLPRGGQAGGARSAATRRKSPRRSGLA